MIKNGAAVVVALALAACGSSDPSRGRYQGMIELEQIGPDDGTLSAERGVGD